MTIVHIYRKQYYRIKNVSMGPRIDFMMTTCKVVPFDITTFDQIKAQAYAVYVGLGIHGGVIVVTFILGVCQ